jgi:Ni,Fe-hydrogenase III component G
MLVFFIGVDEFELARKFATCFVHCVLLNHRTWKVLYALVDSANKHFDESTCRFFALSKIFKSVHSLTYLFDFNRVAAVAKCKISFF